MSAHLPVWFELVQYISGGLLFGAILLVMARLVRGPTSADRVVALDLLAVLSVGFAALYATLSNQSDYVDVSATLAIVAFLATLAFSRYVQRKERKD